MSSMKNVWVIKGPMAGTFQDLPAAQADKLIEEGKAQESATTSALELKQPVYNDREMRSAARGGKGKKTTKTKAA